MIADVAAFFRKEIITDDRQESVKKDWMPYIIERDFEGNKSVGKYEYCYVEKEFKGNQRTDKK